MSLLDWLLGRLPTTPGTAVPRSRERVGSQGRWTPVIVKKDGRLYRYRINQYGEVMEEDGEPNQEADEAF